ncbi:hypothetical protein TNCV_3891281 [Trichonephila clavipes]|nr:hypothetical protein TNCV_3891281 [Trichonephila clavipes]
MGRVLLVWKPRTATIWKAARDSRKKAPPIPALKGPAKIAYSDAEKSEIIADSLQDQFKLNNISNDTDRAITHVVHTYLNNTPTTKRNYRAYR